MKSKKNVTILISIGSLIFILLSLLIESNISASFSFVFGLVGIGYINYDEFAKKLDIWF
ncbi:hypothetical protein [Sulfurimonas sp.]|uniref:hypothetical protein n=1 Tax=Sulfurimonas sp. TaxID=2022749 RepID=UPI0025CB9B29|nr:hypothetical protein [Sulfurimonas sp.]